MKMIGLELKLGFFNNEQAHEFLKLLGYMQWCGEVGHSAGITVNADGDGNFRMVAMMKDPKDGQMKNVREIIHADGEYFEGLVKEHGDWKQSERDNGIPEERIDRNEVSFDFGE